MFTEDDLDTFFSFNAAITEYQAARADRIRKAARVFAQAVLTEVPEGTDQSAVIRKIRESMFTSVDAICKEKS